MLKIGREWILEDTCETTSHQTICKKLNREGSWIPRDEVVSMSLERVGDDGLEMKEMI